MEGLRASYAQLAERILTAPLDRYLRQGDEAAYLDLKVSLILLAVHEAFSGFVMTGEAADFVASVMAPHPLVVCDPSELIGARNDFVQAMAKEMSYWAAWPLLEPGSLPPVAPPDVPELRRMLDVLLTLPLGARAHAVDAIRHLSAHPHLPKTLASLSRYETRKRGLDVASSSRLILESGLVVRATDLDGWLGSWTRRDLLGFLAQSGVGARNSWGKERLAEVAKSECATLLYARMDDAGVVELAPEHVEGARLLREHVESTRECWRVWLAFGTGIADH